MPLYVLVVNILSKKTHKWIFSIEAHVGYLFRRSSGMIKVGWLGKYRICTCENARSRSSNFCLWTASHVIEPILKYKVLSLQSSDWKRLKNNFVIIASCANIQLTKFLILIIFKKVSIKFKIYNISKHLLVLFNGL